VEGNIYKCGWKKNGRRYQLWVQSHPQVSVESAEFDEGYDELADGICRSFGDGEAILEFEPAPPVSKTSKKYLTPDIVLIGFHRFAEGPWWSDGLFTKGYCRFCAMGMGERTDQSAVVEKAAPHDVLGLRSGNYGTTLRLFSEEFLGLLSENEKASFRFQEVENRSRIQKTFKELRATPLLGYVGFKGAKYNQLSCWRCANCGYRAIHPKHPLLGFDVSRFIAAADLPTSLPSCFVIGQGVNLDFVMTRERWMQIRGKPGTKGIEPVKIGVIPESELVRNPKLRDGGDLQRP
jgi:hypothetical protein